MKVKLLIHLVHCESVIQAATAKCFFSTRILYIFDVTSVTNLCENNRFEICNILYEKS